MSVESALRAAGVSEATAGREAPRAVRAMLEARITTQQRAAFFLAQVLHESGRLRFFEELADGSAYEGRCKDLGNCHPGDGKRYKGRGPIQLTGRANYRAAGKALGLPLEEDPELAAGHAVGWRIAGWYWSTRGLNVIADAGRFLDVTRRINGGLNGLTDRRALLAAVSKHVCKPGPADWLTPTELRWVRQYDRLLRRQPDASVALGKLRRLMTAQRKRIWRRAQPKAKGGDGRGWDASFRRQRYESLLARTR